MASTRPNLLFFLPDQHRPDWLGVNSDLPLRTPNLDRLAASGVQFVNAFTPSPLCAPARACLASGWDYERCRVPSNRETYPLDLPTYYQRLRDAGYRVAGVGKFDLHKDLAAAKAELDWYLDGSRLLTEWGFTEGIDNEGKMDGSAAYRAAGRPKGPYLHFLQQRGLAEVYVQEHAESGAHRNAYVTALPEDAYCDNWIAENGLRFLRDFPRDRPWHLVINFTGPHGPMDVTQGMHDAWADVSFPMPLENTQPRYSTEDHQRNRQHYAAMIENIDRQVGRFIDAVRARGELDRTLIVYASDHGEMLGDHNRWGKGTWTTPSSGIPMIVAGPGVREGVMSEALVSLHDLTATFLAYAGTEPLPLPPSGSPRGGEDWARDLSRHASGARSPHDRWVSRSLRDLLEGRTDRHREVVVSGLGDWRMVVDGHYKLVMVSGNPPLLYDLHKDPHEFTSVAEAHPEVVRRLRRILEDARSSALS